jgi:hypothetical protein
MFPQSLFMRAITYLAALFLIFILGQCRLPKKYDSQGNVTGYDQLLLEGPLALGESISFSLAARQLITIYLSRLCARENRELAQAYDTIPHLYLEESLCSAIVLCGR